MAVQDGQGGWLWLEEGRGVGWHEPQALQEIAESRGHFARLLQQDQSTSVRNLEKDREREREKERLVYLQFPHMC